VLGARNSINWQNGKSKYRKKVRKCRNVGWNGENYNGKRSRGFEIIHKIIDIRELQPMLIS
jgi:hypothetical protein